ncbi:Uncharacterised protein [Neisseria meningitidis]|nr:Uncharacterised protein [Neisseria meningitidis]CWS33998.1 Uncharacterised protein [Neisseria meningitidis]
MLPRRIGNDFSAQHTGNLFDPLDFIQYTDFADGLLSLAVLAHPPVVFAAGCDLRKMGNGKHLMFSAQRT